MPIKIINQIDYQSGLNICLTLDFFRIFWKNNHECKKMKKQWIWKLNFILDYWFSDNQSDAKTITETIKIRFLTQLIYCNRYKQQEIWVLDSLHKSKI